MISVTFGFISSFVHGFSVIVFLWPSGNKTTAKSLWYLYKEQKNAYNKAVTSLEF